MVKQTYLDQVKQLIGQHVMIVLFIFAVVLDTVPGVQGQSGEKDQIARLIEDLKSPNENVQQQAASALFKKSDVRALEPLMSLCKNSKNKGVYWSSYQAVINMKDPLAVEPLIKYLKSGEGIAAQALGNLRDTRAVEPLLAVLEQTPVEKDTLRCNIIEALGKIRDKRAVRPLLPLLENELVQVRTETIRALGAIGDQGATQSLIGILNKEKDVWLRRAAAIALGEIGDPQSREALQSATKDADGYVSNLAKEALKSVDARIAASHHNGDSQVPSRSVEQLIEDLRSDEWAVRGRAAIALAKLNDTRAVGPLFECLKEAEKQGKVEWKHLQSALLTIKNPKAIDEYVKQLKDGNKVAAQALRNYPDPKSTDALVAVLVDPKYEGIYQFHWEAAESLGALKDPRAVPALLHGLSDSNEVVRTNCSKVLGPMGNLRAVEPLITILQNETAYAVRLQATISLGLLKDRRAVPSLIIALKKDEQPYVRMQAAHSLGNIGDSSAAEALKTALTDKDPLVQQAAGKALPLLKEQSPAPPTEVISNPLNGSKNVDPAAKTITITFPTEMRKDSYTIIAAPDGALPEPLGSDPYVFRDARTFVMQVKLEPDTAYAFALNSARRQGFKHADGTSLTPTVIRFRTGSAQGVPQPLPDASEQLIVSKELQGKPGEYATISQAIKEAKSGATITVYPGIYAEAIILDRTVTITRKAGEQGAVIIEATDGPCIQMKTDRAVIRGLVFRGKGGIKNNKYYAVDIPQGELIIEDCDITSDSHCAVYVHGERANPTLRRCKIHDAKEAGIFFVDKASGTLEASDIYENTLAGVEIAGLADPTLRKCTIRDGKQSGIYSHQKGMGKIIDCQISGNSLAGIQLHTGAKSIITNCKIFNGKQGGVLVDELAEGVFEDCNITGNLLAAIEVKKGGNPFIKRCHLHANKSAGVYAHTQGKGTFEECDIEANGWCEVAVASESDPVFRKCKIHDSIQSGLFVYQQGKGLFENCTIWATKFSGVEVQSAGNPTLKECTIRDGQSNGLRIITQGEGTYSDCDISGHPLAEVYTATGGKPTLRKCKIHDGRQSGLFVENDGEGLLENCAIYEMGLSCVEVRTGGNPVLRSCQIHDSSQAGIFVHNKGAGTFEGCDIYANTFAGIEIGAEGSPTFRQSTMRNGKASGVVIRTKAKGTVENCKMFGNASNQLFVEDGADTVLRNNQETKDKTDDPPAPKENVQIPSDSKDAVLFFEKIGGHVEVDEQHPNHPIKTVDLSAITDLKGDSLKRLKEFPRLKLVRLGNSNISDHDLIHISNLMTLEALDLRATKITHAGLAHLRGLKQLAELDLEDTAIDDAGLAQLNQLTNIVSLNLNGTKVTDAGMRHLQKMEDMIQLALNGTSITDKGLAFLKNMVLMQKLHLVGTEISDAGLANLQTMIFLRNLDLSFTKVGNQGLAKLKEMVLLQELALVETRITDAGLTQLYSMKDLKKLNINLTEVTPAGYRDLKRALTQTIIIYTPPPRNPGKGSSLSLPSLGSAPQSGGQSGKESVTDRLMNAVQNGDVETVQMLLTKGIPFDTRDSHGATALMYAAVNSHHQLIGILLDGGASLKAQDEMGWTPLHYATSANAATVKLLIGKGAGVNAVDKIGYTPLMNAAHLALPEVAQVLLDSGADLNAKTRDGRTAKDMAERSTKGPKVVPILERWANRPRNGSKPPSQSLLTTPMAGGLHSQLNTPTAPPQGVNRVEYKNPIAGFSMTIPEDWEMASGYGGNIEIALDANPGAGLRHQPALWFFYAPNAPAEEARLLARDLKLIGATDIGIRQTRNQDEWEVTGVLDRPILGRVTTRWLLRREREMSYVLGAAVQQSVATRFQDDLDTAFQTCRLINHPILHTFREPTEQAYTITLPEGWQWKGKIIRTTEIPGYFEWEVRSPDSTSGCFSSPPGVFNMFQNYVPARDMARGIVLDGLRQKLGTVRLESTQPLSRITEHYRDGLKMLGFKPKVDRIRADYIASVGNVQVRIRVDVTTLMTDESSSLDPRLRGRGNWFLFVSGVWAPVDKFDDLYPVARGVQVSHRTNLKWVSKQLETIGKVLADRRSAMDEACKGWDAYIRDMERIPDPDGGPIQEVPNRDGGVWKDQNGIMHRVPRKPEIEQAIRNRGWKPVR